MQIDGLEPEVRCQLLMLLSAPSHVRADAIRQFHERGDQGMADVLSDLEAEELLRFRVVEALKQAQING